MITVTAAQERGYLAHRHGLHPAGPAMTIEQLATRPGVRIDGHRRIGLPQVGQLCTALDACRRAVLTAAADQQAVLGPAIRPRQRLLQHGAHTDRRRAVSVLLSTGRAGRNAVAVAERLLTAVGGVPGAVRHPKR